MSWRPLAERFSSLPLILAGPVLRRTEPRAVSVWLALKAPRVVTLRVYRKNAEGDLVQELEGCRHTVRLGDHLHIVVVTACASNEQEGLGWGQTYYYNLFFADDDGTPESQQAEGMADLHTLGVLTLDPASADALSLLVYPGHPLPRFVLPAEDLNQLRILHGSCRKPHGVGKEMLSAVDAMLEEASKNGERELAGHPQQLFLTGDQIYGDDVATPLLYMLIDAGYFLLQGNEEEVLPLVQKPARMLAPGTRTDVVLNKALFTTSTPHNQLLSFAEYACMYLFAWSDVLWPPSPPQELPTQDDIWSSYPEALSQAATQKKMAIPYEEQVARLEDFRETLPQVRRALANIATYMICDDHDVTDDWYLDGAWCKRVLESPLGHRVVRNALLAYTLFQAWGNTPDQFEEAHGRELLDTLDDWRGEKSEAREQTIERVIGLPASFGGSGVLPYSEQALRWYYTFSGPRYQLIVMDTRTERLYRTPGEFPGLLAPDAIQRQIVAAMRADAEVTIIISATPVLGVGSVEAVQFWSRLRIKNNYTYDREAWNLEWGTFQHFLKTVSRMKRAIILSGDVHYAFAASLEFWDLTRNTTAKIVNFTSSPLRNEGSSTQMALLAVGYPYLYSLLRHTQMPTTDFFAWDIDSTSKRQILKKMLEIIRSRMLFFWWSVPRYLAALRTPYEIVLPAQGWPKGAFNTIQPDRTYRLHYLRDTLRRDTNYDMKREQKPGALPHISRRFTLKRLAIRLLNFVESQLGRVRRRLARRSLAAQQRTDMLPKGTHHIIRGSIRGAAHVERSLERRKNRLAEVLFHREEWLEKWKAGTHIVGYANIGEIGFHWNAEAKTAFQRLWWWQQEATDANASEHPMAGTEYEDTLEPPKPDEAPKLP